MTIMSTTTEIATLNDGIGILVLAQIHLIGSKLFIEDFKIEFNSVSTDDQYLVLTFSQSIFNPIYNLMLMFRPMFFVMVTTLLICWPYIFDAIASATLLHFYYFLIFWICMFAVTELVVMFFGHSLIARFSSVEETKSESADPNNEDHHQEMFDQQLALKDNPKKSNVSK